MTPVKRRLVLLPTVLIMVCLLQSVPPLFSRAPGAQKTGLAYYKDLPVKQLEEKLETAEGNEKTLLFIALAWNLKTADTDRSLAYSREALGRAEKAADPALIFQVYNGMGACYYVNNRFRDAVRYYLEALKLEHHIEDRNGVANLLTNLGMVYWKLGRPGKAEEYHRRGLEIREKTGSPKHLMGYSLLNLGLALGAQGKTETALEHYREALKLFTEAGHKRGMAAALNNAAGIYQGRMKDYSKALEYYTRAIPLYKEAGDRRTLANVYRNIGVVNIDLRRFQEAGKYLEMAMDTAVKTKDQFRVFGIYAAYRNLYTDAGDFKRALEYSKKNDKLGDTFFNETSNSRITRLAAEYDAQKKESEIQLLEKTKTNQRKLLTLLGLLVLLSLAVAAVLYSRFRARKKAGRLLESEESKYRSLFEHAGDAIFLADETGYIDCNRKAAELFGVTPAEIAGRTSADFSPPTQPGGGDSGEAAKEWREQVLVGHPRRFPWRFLNKDRTPVDTMVTLAALAVDDRDLIQAIVRDITESKRLEEERIKAAELETTARLAGGIAHDFNNLLGVILGNIQLAKMEITEKHPISPNLSRIENAVRSTSLRVEGFRAVAEKEFKSEKR